ncbi:hypothetical protein N7G274_008012 [Stereocaulon virgatum]|uniref:NACHT domain-containing protein n=1 Tax=Stereocaulon virgatum TaxID=373712 RepID=A0ABR4A082_9LECA
MIVLDAFDELNQKSSPTLLTYFQEIIHRCPENTKTFISTRSFPAIERQLNPDQSVEVNAENNGPDVMNFIDQSLEQRIKKQELLGGNVSIQLREDIKNVLTKRAGNM